MGGRSIFDFPYEPAPAPQLASPLSLLAMIAKTEKTDKAGVYLFHQLKQHMIQNPTTLEENHFLIGINPTENLKGLLTTIGSSDG